MAAELYNSKWQIANFVLHEFWIKISTMWVPFSSRTGFAFSFGPSNEKGQNITGFVSEKTLKCLQYSDTYSNVQMLKDKIDYAPYINTFLFRFWHMSRFLFFMKFMLYKKAISSDEWAYSRKQHHSRMILFTSIPFSTEVGLTFSLMTLASAFMKI